MLLSQQNSDQHGRIKFGIQSFQSLVLKDNTENGNNNKQPQHFANLFEPPESVVNDYAFMCIITRGTARILLATRSSYADLEINFLN